MGLSWELLLDSGALILVLVPEMHSGKVEIYPFNYLETQNSIGNENHEKNENSTILPIKV